MLAVIFIAMLHFCLIYKHISTSSRAIVSLLCMVQLTTYLFQFSFHLNVLKTILDRVYETLRITLNTRVTSKCNDTRKWPVLKILRKMQRMYCAIFLNHMKFGGTCGIVLVYEFIINIILAILGCYMLLTMWILGNELGSVAFLTEIALWNLLLVVTNMLFCVDSLRYSVSIKKLIRNTFS